MPLPPLKCAGVTVCECAGWCVRERVGCHFNAGAGASRGDQEKGRRKKYLMQVGSTCQGSGGADEVQLVRVFETEQNLFPLQGRRPGVGPSAPKVAAMGPSWDFPQKDCGKKRFPSSNCSFSFPSRLVYRWNWEFPEKLRSNSLIQSVKMKH